MAVINISGIGDVVILPLWAGIPCQDNLSWLTEVQNSWNGNETTHQLRSSARRKITFQTFESSVNKANAFIDQYGNLAEIWAVPLWFEPITINSVSGQTINVPDTQFFDIESDGYVLVYKTENIFEVRQIAGISADQLSVYGDSLDSIYNSSSFVIPLKFGTIENSVTRTSSGHNNRSKITFEINDHTDNPGSTPTQYNGDDLYTDEIFKKGDTYDSELSTKVNRVDYSTGIFSKDRPWAYPRIVKPNYYLMFTQEEKYNFRRFLDRRKGRYKYFWEPTFEADLTATGTGTIGTSLEVINGTIVSAQQQRKNIAIYTKAGNWVPVVIDSFFTTGDNALLTLGSSLSIAYEDILYISFLGKKRFDTDDINLVFDGSLSFISVSINITEVNP